MRWTLLFALALLTGCLRPDGTPAPPTASDPAPAAPPVTGAWRFHAPDPLPRYEIAWAQVGPKLYEIGGLRVTATPASTVTVYDAGNDSWSLGPDYPMPAHHHAAVALRDGTVLSFGGWIGIGQSATDVAYKLAPGLSAWTPLATMPRARGAHAALLVEGKVWLIGGTGFDGNLLRTIDIYDPATNTYSAGPDVPTPRDHLGVAYLHGDVYVIGGRQRTLATTVGNVDVYNLTAKNWSQRDPMGKARGGFVVVDLDGTLVAMGGEDQGSPRLTNTVEAFDPLSNNWTAWPAMQSPRTGLGGGVWNGRVIAFSGADPSGAPHSDRPESLARD